MRPSALRSRADLAALLGVEHPLDTSPVARLGSTVDRTDDVHVRALELEVHGRVVPCLVLSPAGTDLDGPSPAARVVAVHQHDAAFHLGKSEPAGLAGDPALAYGRALAAAGAVVVAPDLTGFESRQDRRLEGASFERFVALDLLTRGSSLQARHTEDVAACITWLAGLPGPGGVGLVGHSLGGQVAFFTAACDERVRAAMVSCGVGTLESFRREAVLHNPAWYVPGLVRAGDTPAVAGLTEGQDFFVSAGADDPLFPLDGVRAVVDAMPGRVDLTVLAGGHELPAGQLTRGSRWLVDALAAG